MADQERIGQIKVIASPIVNGLEISITTTLGDQEATDSALMRPFEKVLGNPSREKSDHVLFVLVSEHGDETFRTLGSFVYVPEVHRLIFFPGLRNRSLTYSEVETPALHHQIHHLTLELKQRSMHITINTELGKSGIHQSTGLFTEITPTLQHMFSFSLKSLNMIERTPRAVKLAVPCAEKSVNYRVKEINGIDAVLTHSHFPFPEAPDKNYFVHMEFFHDQQPKRELQDYVAVGGVPQTGIHAVYEQPHPEQYHSSIYAVPVPLLPPEDQIILKTTYVPKAVLLQDSLFFARHWKQSAPTS